MLCWRLEDSRRSVQFTATAGPLPTAPTHPSDFNTSIHVLRMLDYSFRALAAQVSAVR